MPRQPWPDHENNVSALLVDFHRGQLFFLHLPAAPPQIGRRIAFAHDPKATISRHLQARYGDARMAKGKAPIIFNTKIHLVWPLRFMSQTATFRRPFSKLPSRALDFSSTIAPPAPRTLSSTSRTKATAQST